MAYQKRNFKKDQLLTADELNKMDDQIALNEESAKKANESLKDKFDKSSVVQEKGNSETAVMSQAAATEEFDKLSEDIDKQHSANISRTNNIIKIFDDNSCGYDVAENLTLESGTVSGGIEFVNRSRVRTSYFIASKNTCIMVEDGFQLTASFYDLDFNFIRDFAFTNEIHNHTLIVGETCVMRLCFAKENSNSEITVDEIKGRFSIHTANPSVFSAEDISFKLGNYTYDNEVITSTRIYSEIVRIPKNTKLSTTEKIYLYIHNANTNGVNDFVQSGWVNEYYFDDEALVRIVMAYKNNSEISNISELKRTLDMIVINHETVSEREEPIFIKNIPCNIIGTISSGVHYDNPTTRAHTDFIKVEKGMVLSVDGYKYSIQFYENSSEDSFYKQLYWLSHRLYAVEENCYIRVVCSHFFDTPNMTANEAVVQIGWCSKGKNADRPFAIVAHRGYTADAADNTIEAFKAAAIAGFKYIETDVQWTSDNIPILVHDSTYGGVAIASRTFTEWQDRGLCSLDDFLKVCKLNNITPIIEFKADLTDARAEYIYNKLSDMNMLDTMFIAFDERNLMYMLNKHPFDIILSKTTGTIPTMESLESFKTIYKRANNIYWYMFAQDFNESYYKLFCDAGVNLCMGQSNDSETFYRWAPYCDMIFTDTMKPPII